MNVAGSIAGPGGVVSIGYPNGNAKEGLHVEYLEAKDAMVVGADGAIMHSLRSGNAARVTVNLLKTSPTNALLSNLYNFQRTQASFWGLNTIAISDVQRGDVGAGSQMAFERHTGVVWAEDANIMQWSFQGNWLQILGSGAPTLV
jgi:hypothetical protein